MQIQRPSSLGLYEVVLIDPEQLALAILKTLPKQWLYGPASNLLDTAQSSQCKQPQDF
jgi:hypothetical protein